MKTSLFSVLSCLLLLSFAAVGECAGWVHVTTPPGINASTMVLLTDGTVMVQDCGNPPVTAHWKKLTPDAFGSYVNGSWSSVADMTTPRLFYASAVLADGRVFVAGGEAGGPYAEYNKAQVYDPVTDTWTSEVVPLTWGAVGDAPCAVLSSGKVLFGNSGDNNLAVFDPTVSPFSTASFSSAATKGDRSVEESWVVLPDGSVFTAQGQNSPGTERYFPTLNQWANMQSVPNMGDLAPAPPAENYLVENSGSWEMGPAFVLPDGRVFYVGATGHTALWTSSGPLKTDLGSWLKGPDFPNEVASPFYPLGAKDAPGSWMPNGQVLLSAGPIDGVFGNYLGPVSFFLYTPGGVNAPGTLAPEAAAPNAPSVPFQGRMLLLPTGEVAFSGSSNDLYLYQPSGGLGNTAWKPTITSWPGKVDPGTTYVIDGTQFTGVSQGANYGDNASMQSNYPLVRITNHATGHVFYCRTHDHSTMAIATGGADVSTFFDAPAGLESGPSDLVVVANGIPSDPIVINGPALTYNAENNLQFGRVCVGESAYLALQVFNVGAQDLTISSVQRQSGSADFSVLPNPKTSLTIPAGEEVDFTVQFLPTGAGFRQATIRISSNDPNTPTVDITATGTGDVPRMSVTPPSVDFGPACPGEVVNQSIAINNIGNCAVTVQVGGIALTGDATDFAVSAPSTPITVAPGSATSIGVSFRPQSFFATARTATVTVTSDAVNSPQTVTLSGTAPPPVLSVTPSPLDFGTVCADDAPAHLRKLQVCNNGSHCPLSVTSVTVSGSDFQVVGPSSVTVAAGTCTNVAIKFTPTSAGPKSATITIASDDPANSTVTVAVTGNTPLASLAAPSYLAFPPTVIQSTGSCFSQKPLPIQNTGQCNETISSVTITGADAGEFTIVGLPVSGLPAVQSPGELLGDGDLVVQFRPLTIRRVHQAQVNITYVLDPVTGSTAQVVVPLYGEGVTTGARVLVRAAGVPVARLDKLQLQRIVGNRQVSNETLQNVALNTVVGPVPELSFQYHREWGGASNPVQILTGNYQLVVTVTVTAKGKKQTKTAYFSLNTCDFNPNIAIDF